MIRWSSVRSLTDLWHKVMEPAKGIPPDVQRQARLLTLLLLTLIGLTVMAILLPPPIGGITPDPLTSTGIAVALIFWSVALFFSRQGRYKRAAVLAIVGIMVIAIAIIFSDPQLPVSNILFALVIPVIISSDFLSTRFTLGTTAFIILLMLSLPSFLPELTIRDVPIPFVLPIAMLLILLSRHRSALEADRQRALQTSESRYRTLFEANAVAIAIHENGRYVDVNPAFEQLYGYTREEMQGKTLFDVAEPGSHPTIRKLLTGDSSGTMQCMAQRKDGTTFEAEVITNTVIYGYRSMRISTVQDITLRIRAEQQRLDLEIEQQRVDLMRQFISHVSHDLRTPLTVVLSSLYLLQRTQDSDARANRVRVIEQQVMHMESMLEDMLTVSRLAAAVESDVILSESNLNTVVREAVEGQQMVARERGLILRFNAEDTVIIVHLDHDHFKRALRQLLTNAIMYTPNGGQVIVSTEVRAGHAIIRISDTGIGISREDQERIFEPLYRADRARNMDTGGMGLGLTICRQIVEAHGGRVEVESIPNQGSTFTIWLPLPPETPSQPRQSAVSYS